MISLPILPTTRADCIDGIRPCPHVSCRYHLAELWGDARPEDADTCALDIADRGDHDASDLAAMLGTPDSTLSDIEARAIQKLRKALGAATPQAELTIADRVLAVLRTSGPLSPREIAEVLGDVGARHVAKELVLLKRVGKTASVAYGIWRAVDDTGHEPTSPLAAQAA